MAAKVTKVKKRPSSEDVKNLLLEGNFGLSTDDALPLTDPISTTQMVLKLEDIKPYDKNPRRERNPEYEKIKASIRSKKQLNNNFNVTRRPGDDLLMVESGGNTRLSILKELYKETADEAFNTVHCLFVPWTSESSILTAHLIENEMRGDMMGFLIKF
jgi:ParB family protein of integrating conjugative element (PFGI_1 class)